MQFIFNTYLLHAALESKHQYQIPEDEITHFKQKDAYGDVALLANCIGKLHIIALKLCEKIYTLLCEKISYCSLNH